MKKINRVRLVNIFLWGLLLGLCVYDGFIAESESSFARGQLRGGVIAVAAFLLIIYPLLTIILTKKSGGDSKQIRKNIKRNYLLLISTEWWNNKN